MTGKIKLYYFSFKPPTWSQVGITENEAIIKCRDAIQASSSFSACNKLLGDEVTSVIDTCVLDLQWTGENSSWPESAVATIQHRYGQFDSTFIV